MCVAGRGSCVRGHSELPPHVAPSRHSDGCRKPGADYLTSAIRKRHFFSVHCPSTDSILLVLAKTISNASKERVPYQQ